MIQLILRACVVGFILAHCSEGMGMRGPDFYTDVLLFKGRDNKYIEIQTYFTGSSFKSVAGPDSLWRKAAEVTLIVFKDSTIIHYDRLSIHAPPTMSQQEDFLDIRRFGLKEGNYVLEIFVNDLQRDSEGAHKRIHFNVPDEEGACFVSDIMLLASIKPDSTENIFVRNGYYMEPLPHGMYHSRFDLLYFYVEVSQNDTTIWKQPYVIRFQIASLSSGETWEKVRTKNRVWRSKDPIMMQMNIRDLPGGSYKLVVEITDPSGGVIQRKEKPFLRVNPIQYSTGKEPSATLGSTQDFLENENEASLNYILKAIAPRAWENEVDIINNVIRQPNLKAKRDYIIHFFSRENKANPQEAYLAYMEVARTVDHQMRAAFGHGFETDRGRVLMRYGRPNDIIDVEDEPHAPPYQIWVYYTFPYTGQRDVKFLFFNPSLAPNDYVLLHSTARNERQNPRWEIDLYSRLGGNEFSGPNVQDARSVPDQFFRMARKHFDDN